jgi:hypothetical protein
VILLTPIDLRLWRGRPGLASRRHLAGAQDQGQDALATSKITKATPCDRAIFSIVEIYTIYNRKATIFIKKYAPPQNPPQKHEKRKKNRPYLL